MKGEWEGERGIYGGGTDVHHLVRLISECVDVHLLLCVADDLFKKEYLHRFLPLNWGTCARMRGPKDILFFKWVSITGFLQLLRFKVL